MTEEVEAHIQKRYNLLKKVGSGAYGHVWKVTDKRTGEVLALKKIFDAFQHSTDAQRTFREITLLHDIDHPNVIKLHQVIRAENDKDLYLVFEFMEADLHNAIGQKILKDPHNKFIMYQLVRGIKFLHSAEIIHRDLKPSNLLLNSDCSMKICDFGLARSLAADQIAQDMVLTEEVATRWYRSPEVLLGSHTYDKSADIWSVGCILAEILIGKPIFPGNSTLNQLERILHFTGKPSKEDIDSLNAETAFTMIEQVSHIKQRPFSDWFKADTSQEGIALVVRMLQFNPEKRPTAAELLRSSYLSSFCKPKQEYDSKKVIRPPISDNTKLNLKDYRLLIYDHIKKVYRQQVQQPVQASISFQSPHPPSTSQHAQNSSHQSQPYHYISSHASQDASIKKIDRPSTSHKYEGQYIQRTNSSNVRSEKPKTSDNKTVHHVFSSGKMNTSASYHEDEDKLKKKNSLKEILKNKKPVTPYRATVEKSPQMSQPIKRFVRESESTLFKQNRVIHAWDKK